MKVVSNLHQLDIGAESKNIIVTICDINHIHVLKEVYQKLKNQGHEVKIICLEFEVERELRAREIPFFSLDDYTSAKTYDNFLSTAYKLAMTWHQSNESYAVYNGISLGALVQWGMMYFLNEVLKAVRETKLIIEKEHPDAIIFLGNPPKEVNSILLTPSEDWHKDAAKLLLGNTLEIYSIEIQRTRPFTDNTWRDFPNELRSLVKNIARQIVKQVIKWVPSFLDKPLEHNILFSEIGGYIGYGVSRELKRKPQNKVILLSRTLSCSFIWSFIRNFFKRNLSYNTLERYANPRIDEIIEEERQRLSKEWLIFKDDPQILEHFKFDGISIWDLVKDRLSYLFHEKFPIMVREIELTKKCYDRMKISAIVVPYDTVEFEKMLVQVGNLKDIYSLVVSHGVIGNIKILWGFLPLFATKIAIGGEALKNILIDKGCAEEKIEVTGFPRFDSYFNLDHKSEKSKISRKLKLPSDAKIIFFAAQSTTRGIRFRNLHLYPRELEEMVRAVISAMRNFPDVYLIIKGRSYTDEQLPRMIIEETGIQNVRVVTNVDIKSLVCACDVLITGWSTVGLEAMIVNKSVITINLRTDIDFVPYARLGAAIGVYKAEDLPMAIEKSLYNYELVKEMQKCQKEFVYQYAHIQDGKASSRVANLIEYSINKKERGGVDEDG